MTEDEISRIKKHIEIHARQERRAVIITEILRKAIDELEHTTDIVQKNEQLKELCNELELINQKVIEENEQLKQQIEKIKRCANCPNWIMNSSIKYCDDCKNKDILPIMNGS